MTGFFFDAIQLPLDFGASSQDSAPLSARATEPVRTLASPVRSRAAMEHALATALGRPLRLVITDNRQTMISARESGGARVIRLHHMFLSADQSVLNALVAYLARGDRAASRRIDRFIRTHRDVIRGSVRMLRPRGAVHDLEDIRDEVSREYFQGSLSLPMTWGRPARGAFPESRRSIHLGSYHVDGGYVRVHPALDHALVPRYVVAWVVFHEMLHHVVPMPERDGRVVAHSEEFRRRESQFADLDRAHAWQRDHLSALLASPAVIAPCGT